MPRPSEAARRTKTYDRWLQAPLATCRPAWAPRPQWGRWTGGPECRVCTHSPENGLTPTRGAVDVFKVMEKQVSLSLALRAPAEPGRRSQTWEPAEQASAGQVVGRLLCVSAWTCPVIPGSGCRMRSSIGSAWGPAPQGPWSEQLRMDVLLDGMRRGHPVPGWAGHRACGPDLVSTWKGSHTNTHDLCPGLSGRSGLAWAPSVRPPRRYSGLSPCLGSVGVQRPCCYTGLLPLGARGQAHVRASWALARASSGVSEPESGVLSMSPIGYGRVRAPMWAKRAARGLSPLFLGSAHMCSTAGDVHLPGQGHAEQPHPPHNELMGLK